MGNTEKKTNENPAQEKKQILLRLSPSLHNELAAWAEDDFRSINGQIEYLLSEAVKKRKGDKYTNKKGIRQGYLFYVCEI